MNDVILISNSPLLIINLAAENICWREHLNIRPLRDGIIVKKLEEEAKTACGINIPKRPPKISREK